MGNWKLLVEDYGKIKSAEIEIAPLTLFVGDNNSGKSYLLSLLWGIENLGIETILGDDFMEMEQAESLKQWIWKQIDIAIETKENIVSISSVSDMMEELLNLQLEKNKNRFVKSIFNSEDVEIGRLVIKFTDIKKQNIYFKMNENGTMKIYVDQQENNILIYDVKTNGNGLRKLTNVNMAFITLLYYLVMGIEKNEEGYIYLPSARTGFMLTKDVINKVGRKNTFNILEEKELITPFVRPINQFLDIIGDLSIQDTGSEKIVKLVESLESEVVDGTVEIKKLCMCHMVMTKGFHLDLPRQLFQNCHRLF